MNKASRLIKRYIALLLVLLFSIESFAAVVGDNDGAAFITKAEFDSLKNDFQSQLDRYNSSIDSKINGAIASYLSGIRISKEKEVKCATDGYLDVYWQDYFLSKVKWGKWNADGSINRNYTTTSEEVHRIHGTKAIPYRFSSGSLGATWQRAFGGLRLLLRYTIDQLPSGAYLYAGDRTYYNSPQLIYYNAETDDELCMRTKNHYIGTSVTGRSFWWGGEIEVEAFFQAGPYQGYTGDNPGLYNMNYYNGVYGTAATLTPNALGTNQVLNITYSLPMTHWNGSEKSTFTGTAYMLETDALDGNPHIFNAASLYNTPISGTESMQVLHNNLIDRASELDMSDLETYLWTNTTNAKKQIQVWRYLSTAYYDDGYLNVYMDRSNEKGQTGEMNNSRKMWGWSDAQVDVKNWEVSPWGYEYTSATTLNLDGVWGAYRSNNSFSLPMKLPLVKYNEIAKIKTGYLKKGADTLSISQGICLCDEIEKGKLKIVLKYEKGNSNNDSISDSHKIQIDLAKKDYMRKDVDNEFVTADVELTSGSTAKDKSIKKYEVSPSDNVVTFIINDTTGFDEIWMRLSPVNKYGTTSANCDYVKITDLRMSLETESS